MMWSNIFKGLFQDEEYSNIVYAFMKMEYINDEKYRTIFLFYKSFVDKYNKKPSINDVRLMVENTDKIEDKDKPELFDLLTTLEVPLLVDFRLLKDETEKYLQDRAMENAIYKSVQILEEDKDRNVIPELVKDALNVSFTNNLGFEYYSDSEHLRQYQSYTREEEIFKTDIDFVNELVGGGFRRKGLYIFIGRVNLGKCVTYDTFVRIKDNDRMSSVKIGELFDSL